MITLRSPRIVALKVVKGTVGSTPTTITNTTATFTGGVATYTASQADVLGALVDDDATYEQVTMSNPLAVLTRLLGVLRSPVASGMPLATPIPLS